MNLVVVSNRLPVALARDAEGRTVVEPGSGGLVTALQPVLRDRGGRWIGWTGAAREDAPDAAQHLRAASRRFGYELVPIELSAEERELYYHGFSNEVIWPLFHDLLSQCRFEPRYWTAYEAVNRRFAEVTAAQTGPDDFIWVHDYHLYLVAQHLRALGVRSKIALFQHIPFPPLDMFLKLPWRFQILNAMLDFDLLGFQTPRDRRNFLQCVRLVLRDAEVRGKGAVVNLETRGRTLRVGSFPISIDTGDFERRFSEPDVLEKKQKIRDDAGGRRIVLGVDRLDYTKGLPHKLNAFRNLLERRPEWRHKVTLIQIVVPSREEIPGYQEQKESLDQLVGQINGEFTREGWVPIHYIYRSLEGPRLPAYYTAADVALVTPLKDGMNLVSKEYCASRVDEQGVLVLSEFAGAAAQLQKGALLVNPFDVEGVADALHAALQMRPSEQRRRMRRLRRAVKGADIHGWVDDVLRAAAGHSLADFPLRPDYIPESPRPESPRPESPNPEEAPAAAVP